MRIALRRSVALVSHCPRHAEVDQERTTGFESDNQILAASLDGRDGLSLQLGRDLAWLDGPCHARIEDLDTVEPPADEDGLEANSNRLDLGQLRHGASVAAAFQGGSRGIGGALRCASAGVSPSPPHERVSRMTPRGGGASSASS